MENKNPNPNLIAFTLELFDKMIGKKRVDVFRAFIIKNFLFKKEFVIIQHCFDAHKADISPLKIKFTLYQCCEFWLTRRIGDVYTMASRDGTVVECKVAYYPMPGYADLRALIEIKLPNGGTDFREVPIHYLKRKHGSK